jgi:hypothetical protein
MESPGFHPSQLPNCGYDGPSEPKTGDLCLSEETLPNQLQGPSRAQKYPPHFKLHEE